MWFRSLFYWQNEPLAAGIRQFARHQNRRLLVEALEVRSVLSAFVQTNLAADQPGVALVHDPELIDAWGISVNPNGTFWVSARATGVSTVYSGDVTRPDGTVTPFVKSGLTVTVPGGAPTGQVFSGSSDFVVSAGGVSLPARFIFASETGQIAGWNSSVPTGPVPLSRVAHSKATTPGAVYTGLAIGTSGTANFLYAADFKSGEIDVFDKTYAPTTLAGTFVDPTIPADYAPFNIWNLGGQLYVTYAKQDNGDALPDGGTGFVSDFDTSGNFLNRVVSHDHLNEPWGLALAPANFGEFSNALLVGNFGDGAINSYEPTSGAFLGRLANETGETLHIDGLLGMHFGNGTVSGDRNALYFAATTDGGAHGLFGSLRVAPARVESVVVNDGAAQRSMVRSLTVNFDGPVILDPGAFELSRQDGSVVTLNVDASIVSGRTELSGWIRRPPGRVGWRLSQGKKGGQEQAAPPPATFEGGPLTAGIAAHASQRGGGLAARGRSQAAPRRQVDVVGNKAGGLITRMNGAPRKIAPLESSRPRTVLP